MMPLLNPAKSDTTEWIQIVRSEFLEMPALALSRPQIQRLFGLDAELCELLIHDLVSSGFLVRRPDGNYARPHDDV
jgi:hypothetical protein